METSILKKAGEFLAEKSRRRYWQAGVGILGAAVIATTAYVLSQPAQTLVRETYCGLEEHEHGEACYELVLSCGLEEAGADTALSGEGSGASGAGGGSGAGEGLPAGGAQSPEDPSGEGQEPAREEHRHDEGCYTQETFLACGQGEAPIHKVGCYAGYQELLCGQEESESHTHTGECYGVEELKALACGMQEGPGHVHVEEGDGSCYITVGARKVTCGQEASEAHAHTDGCYELLGEADFLCRDREAAGTQEGHVHTEACYTVTPLETLTCQEEETPGHTHGEACYQVTQKDTIVCGLEESEGHAHTEACHEITEEKETICGLEEAQGHTHGEECYETTEEKELTCGLEENQGTEGQDTGTAETQTPEEDAHIHTPECCQTVTSLTCGKEEYIPQETPAPEAEQPGRTGNGETGNGETGNGEAAADGSEASGQEEGETGSDSLASEEESGEESGSAGSEADGSTASDGDQSSDETQSSDKEESETGSDSLASEGESEEGTKTSGESGEGTDSSASGEGSGGAHVHTEACYKKVLTCEKEEHRHSEDCYRERYCGLTAHTHGEACRDGAGELACGLPEHTHQENCFREPHCGTTAHIHTAECLDGNGEPACGMEEHEHTEDCFEGEPFYCGALVHSHGEECLDGEGNPVCGQADFLVHVHNEDCYNALGRLSCPLPEVKEHTHTADCYGQEGEGAEPTCGLEEIEVHEHEENCYDEEGGLTCGRPQVKAHVHSGACHEEPAAPGEGGAQKPGQETGAAGEGETKPFYCQETIHAHDGSCLDEAGNQVCGKADFAAHVHTEDCYGAEGALTCPLPEIEAHTHTAECYGEANEQLEAELVCEKEELKLHEHTEDCYGESGELACGKLEILEHVHSGACHVRQEEEEAREVTYYCLETVHEHTAACHDENGVLVCGEADYAVHSHAEECYGAQEGLICPLPEVEAHAHTEACYDGNGGLACGQEERRLHSHTQECYDENGSLVCGQTEVLEHIHSAECEVSHKLFKKTYEGENFTVTASYKADANIPEEAELIVEQITEESDEEHYTTRQMQYQEALGNEKAIMRALLKIGFYVNGEEIEPDSPVTVSIQFLDGDGLLEGSPITIVHFAEEGTGVLDGGDAIDNSTTFRTGSFSEFAIGYGSGVGGQTVLLSDTFQYDDSAVHISFSIRGEATVIGKVQESADVASNEQVITADTDQMMMLRVKVLDEGEQRYQAYSDYLRDGGERDETLFLQVMSFRLFYGDKELDLSACAITTQVEPTKNLLENTQNVEEEEEGSSANFLSVFSLSLDGKAVQENLVEIVPDEEISADLIVENFSEESGLADKNGTSYAAMRVETEADEEAEGQVEGVTTGKAEVDADSNRGATETGTSNAGEDTDIAVAVIVKVNPMFTVQFYANLNAPESTVGTSGTTLPFIDTSNDTGLGRLPENGEMELNEISLGLNTDGSISFNIKPTEIYKREQKEFNPRLGDEFDINYLNSLRDNVHYTKKELWVLNEIEGESEENRAERALGTERDGNWTIYDVTNGGEANIAFTNNVNLSGKRDEKGRSYIVIEEGTIMRLVYDPASDNYNSKATFYDYDISTGPKTLTTMDTTRGGINAYLPEGGNGRFAFGNANMGTKFQNDTWNGNVLNQYNRSSKGGKDTFKGLTLGLVERMTSSDKGMDVVFSGGVTGPSIGLFGGTSGVGKTIYPNWNLNFSREGDTFTLSSVSMSDGRSVASGLEKFSHPGKYDGVQHSTMIWTNNFWPLDQKYYDGQNTILDHIFGGKDNPTKGSAGKVSSDDDIDHNSYFGMTYSVDFDLVEEYVGPLEYYFYGDDDMWVFLTDKSTNTTTLVCDIGGVHSSVGEYVNLWDYISPMTEGGNSRLDHAKKQYTLSIFYTERGASGSSCWMQFTLPKISQIYNEPYDPNAASLTIRKVARQFPESMKNTEYPFVLKLGGIYNEYTVRRVSATGSTIKEETISTKEYDFNLKSGEYLEVISLPIGTTYWVEEKYDENRPGDYTTTVETTGKFEKEEPKLSVLAHGTINAKKEGEEVIVEHVTVTYTNTYVYKLPATGGSSRNLYTMAGGMVILFSAGLMYRKKFRERRG